MPFEPLARDVVLVSMEDAANPLSAFSKHPFSLEGAEWPSVTHYFEAMKFEAPAAQAAIRACEHPKAAQRLAGRHRREVRKDWDAVKEVFMARGVYRKCRDNDAVAAALVATGECLIMETSQYDYFWGCGRDSRGLNAYGKVLMGVRARLRRLASADAGVDADERG